MSSGRNNQTQEAIGFGSNFFYALGDDNSADDILLKHEPPGGSSFSFATQLSLHDPADEDCTAAAMSETIEALDREAGTESTSVSSTPTDCASDHPPAHAVSPTIRARRLRPFWIKADRNKASYGAPTTLQQVVCTATSTVFRTSAGDLFQVGTLHGRQYSSPRRVEIHLPLHCVQLAAGRHFCLGLLEGGAGVVSWGAGHFGQLGHGPQVSDLEQPQLIPHLLPRVLGMRVASVAAGVWHAAAITQNGACWMWGSNRHGQCCTVSSTSSSSKSDPPTLVVPTPVDTKIAFAQVACGRFHTVGLEKETGRVYTWGSNHYGQCGHASSSSRRERARRRSVRLVEALQRVVIVQVSAGDLHSLALTGGGRVFSWGCGMDGQLGVVAGSIVWPRSRPKLVGDLDFIAIVAGEDFRRPKSKGNDSDGTMAHLLSTIPRIVSIHAAGNYSVAVSSAGHVYSWGGNDTGALGLPTPPHLPIVDPLQQPQNMDLTANKSSGGRRTLEVQSFDCNHDVWLPRRVDALTAGYHVEGIATGPGHLLCWGSRRDERDQFTGEAIVGRTLYELHEEKRWKGQERLPDQLMNPPRDGEFRSSITSGVSAMVDDLASSATIENCVPASSSIGTKSSTTTALASNFSAPEEQRPSLVPRLRTDIAVQELDSEGLVEVGEGLATSASDGKPAIGRKAIGRKLSLSSLFRSKKTKAPKGQEGADNDGIGKRNRPEQQNPPKDSLEESISC